MTERKEGFWWVRVDGSRWRALEFDPDGGLWAGPDYLPLTEHAIEWGPYLGTEPGEGHLGVVAAGTPP